MNTRTVDLAQAFQAIDAHQNNHSTADLVEIKNQLKICNKISKSIEIVSGPITIESLKVGDSILIIDGDLNIDGTIQDCDEVDSSLLVVLGNVTCRDLITLSEIHITGNLAASNIILGDSLCNHTLSVGGDIKCPTILDYGHEIRALGLISAKDIHIFNSVRDKNGSLKSNLGAADMVDDITQEDHGEVCPSLPKTINYICANGSQFRKS